MPDLVFSQVPPRPQLLEQLRGRLDQIDPTLRLLAQGILGADGPIDFVAADDSGRAVLLLVAGPGEDLEVVARGLAQRAWVEPRLADWQQLAPNLGLRPEAGARLVLLCPEFGPNARAAAQAADPDAISLVAYRCLRNGGDPMVLIDTSPGRAADRAPAAGPSSSFRTGLSEADLGLSAEERSEFE